MREENISKMNFKELRSEVQLLRDELAIFKRKYEDAINNLDSDNFGKSFTLEKDNMKTQIQITADKISAMVSKTDLETMLEEYSTIEQTAEKIQMTVTKIENELKKYSTIEQTAEKIETEVVNINKKFNSYSTIEQTNDSISSVVSKNISAYFTSETKPTSGNTTSEQKTMLCLYNNKYYYYNDIKEKWREYPASGIKTMFKQTSSGFSLTGDVSISGDLITTGNIKGLTVGTNPNIWGDGVWLNSETQCLEVYYNGVVVAKWGFNVLPGGSTIYPVGSAKLIISNVTANGVWDFSGCDEIKGLPGATATAVFG